jgi:hypothetical protein
MIGAIVVVGMVAVMSSAMATLNNWTLARKYPGMPFHMSPDTPADVYVRVTCYRLVARVFYYQSLIFWSLLAILLCVQFTLSGWDFYNSSR